MEQKLVLLLHGTALFNYLLGIYYDLNHLQLPEPVKSLVENTGAPLKGRVAYLTFLNMVSYNYSQTPVNIGGDYSSTPNIPKFSVIEIRKQIPQVVSLTL